MDEKRQLADKILATIDLYIKGAKNQVAINREAENWCALQSAEAYLNGLKVARLTVELALEPEEE